MSFGEFPFEVKCAECGRVRDVRQCFGFLEDTDDVRARIRFCSSACYNKAERLIKGGEEDGF